MLCCLSAILPATFKAKSVTSFSST
jgi:hypothetical protein